MVWAWRWSVALHAFYRQILSLLYTFFLLKLPPPARPGTTCNYIYQQFYISLDGSLLFYFSGGMLWRYQCCIEMPSLFALLCDCVFGCLESLTLKESGSSRAQMRRKCQVFSVDFSVANVFWLKYRLVLLLSVIICGCRFVKTSSTLNLKPWKHSTSRLLEVASSAWYESSLQTLYCGWRWESNAGEGRRQ